MISSSASTGIRSAQTAIIRARDRRRDGRLRQFGVRVPKLLLPSEVGGKQGRAMTAIEGGVIDGRTFYRFHRNLNS